MRAQENQQAGSATQFLDCLNEVDQQKKASPLLMMNLKSLHGKRGDTQTMSHLLTNGYLSKPTY